MGWSDIPCARLPTPILQALEAIAHSATWPRSNLPAALRRPKPPRLAGRLLFQLLRSLFPPAALGWQRLSIQPLLTAAVAWLLHTDATVAMAGPGLHTAAVPRLMENLVIWLRPTPATSR